MKPSCPIGRSTSHADHPTRHLNAFRGVRAISKFDWRKVAQELAYDLPRSVRERAVAAVLRSQTWARKEAEYSARITEKPDGHCSIRCTIKALDQELFCLDIGTPDRLSADLVKKQFILKGNEIYQMLITKLTE